MIKGWTLPYCSSFVVVAEIAVVVEKEAMIVVGGPAWG